MSFGALKKLADMQQQLTPQPSLDVRGRGGTVVFGHAAQAEHEQHLEAFRGFVEAAAAGQISPSVFTSTLVQAAEVIRRDSASFPLRTVRRPGLEAIAHTWLELNELTLEAYVQARHFSESADPADLDEALFLLEEVLEARSACYSYFD